MHIQPQPPPHYMNSPGAMPPDLHPLSAIHMQSQSPPRYTDSPEAPSPETFSPESQKLWRIKYANHNRPKVRFYEQADREAERLKHQQSLAAHGRRQTLPYDDSMDLMANSQNNVRARWVAQGIWHPAWGPAWPSGTRITPRALPPRGPRPSMGLWPHEDGSAAASMPNTAASRPDAQFLSELQAEQQWLRDEEHARSGAEPDADTLGASAYTAVRQVWLHERLWDPSWTADLPGPRWSLSHPRGAFNPPPEPALPRYSPPPPYAHLLPPPPSRIPRPVRQGGLHGPCCRPSRLPRPVRPAAQHRAQSGQAGAR